MPAWQRRWHGQRSHRSVRRPSPYAGHDRGRDRRAQAHRRVNKLPGDERHAITQPAIPRSVQSIAGWQGLPVHGQVVVDVGRAQVNRSLIRVIAEEGIQAIVHVGPCRWPPEDRNFSIVPTERGHQFFCLAQRDFDARKVCDANMAGWQNCSCLIGPHFDGRGEQLGADARHVVAIEPGHCWLPVDVALELADRVRCWDAADARFDLVRKKVGAVGYLAELLVLAIEVGEVEPEQAGEINPWRWRRSSGNDLDDLHALVLFGCVAELAAGRADGAVVLAGHAKRPGAGECVFHQSSFRSR